MAVDVPPAPSDPPPPGAGLLSPVTRSCQPGDAVGPYRVERAVGSDDAGGELYLARGPQDERVVLKLLRPAGWLDPTTRERFAREGALLETLEHEHVVGLAGRGIDPRFDRPWLALVHVPGVDLGELLLELPEGRLAPEEALHVLASCASGLAAAHAQGVVHRDLKPRSVLVGESGDVKLTDFGIALPLEASVRATAHHEIPGTPLYLAPEVLIDWEWSPAADLYALGVTAYHALAGRPPFTHRTTQDLIRAHLAERPPALDTLVSDLPAGVSELVERLLAKDPGRRPRAAELRAELERRGLLGRRFTLEDLRRRAPGRPATQREPLPAAWSVRSARAATVDQVQETLAGAPELMVLREGAETTIPLLGELVLGSRADADLVLADPGVAPTHLAIRPWGEGEYLLVPDQRGRLPVVVNDHRVTQVHRLAHGDRVEVGALTLRFLWPTSRVALAGAPAARTLESRGRLDPRRLFRRPDAEREAPRALRTLYELLDLASTASSESDLLAGGLRLAVEGVGGERGAVLTADAGALRPLVVHPSPAPGKAPPLPFGADDVRAALVEGVASVGVDGEGRPTACVPVAGGDGQPSGALCCARGPGADPLGPGDLDVLAAVARQVGLGLARVRLLKELRAKTLELERLDRRHEAVLDRISEGLALVRRDRRVVEALNPPGAALLRLAAGVESGAALPAETGLGELVAAVEAGPDERRELRREGAVIAAGAARVEALEAVVVVLRDVTAEREREEDHRRAQLRLQREILEISQREQRRIGQDIHDGLCQDLIGTAFVAKRLARRLEPEEAASAEEIAELISQAASRARGLAHGLSPVALESLGLWGALEELAGQVERLYGIECALTGDPEIEVADEDIAIHLYYLAREAAGNAVKHGGAGDVRLRLERRAGRLVLEVTDDGEGFSGDPDAAGGLGIPTMRYRAEVIGGALELGSRPEGGARVACSLPWPARS